MKRPVTVRSSVSPDVMLAYCMLKIYVPGGVGAEGLPYHADDGSFVLGAIPEDEASGGRTVGHKNPKYVARHKGHQFGGPGLNELSFRWKTRERERAFHLVSTGDRLTITQAVCGYPGDGQRRPLMSLPSDRADGRVDVRVAQKPSDKEADTSVCKVVR